LLDGEMWYYAAGQTEKTVYRPGDTIYLGKGEAKCYRIVDHAWILEYARGPIPTMLPFGLADSLFSTLDYKTVFRTFRIYGRHVIRNTFRR
jgi:C-8 sterol isomerase